MVPMMVLAVDLAGARWRKSSYSGGDGDESNCVEVAWSGPVLTLPAAVWSAFLQSTR